MRFWLGVAIVVGFAGVVALARRAPNQQVGRLTNGGNLVATGQAVRPAGESFAFGGRPVDLTVGADGRTVYVKDNRGVVVLDAVSGAVRQELKFPSGGGSMHGIAVSRDGKRLFATNLESHLYVGTVDMNGKLAWSQTITLAGPRSGGASYPCGIALNGAEEIAYVCLSRSNSLAVVDLLNAKVIREIPVGIAPLDVAISPNGRTAYVSNWGGRRPQPGERTAKSAGSDVLVDPRGVASSGTVSVVDLTENREIVQLPVGLHPSDIVLSRDGGSLYVANANSDTVSVVNTSARRVRETILVRPASGLPFGSAPTGLALDDSDRTLYVTLGGNNALAMVQTARGSARSRVTGYIPVGWFPGAVAIGGGRVFVANVKGDGEPRKPPAASGFNTHQHRGTITRLMPPSVQELARYTEQVRRDTRVQVIINARRAALKDKNPVPVPERAGEPSAFEHVVYVIKENRTYDQVFGDLAKGDGDPSLCIYPRKVTPNHHALAEQFVLLDNFYCNGVLSADGHSWATEGNVTDHLEKAFGGFTRSYTFGDDPLTYSSTGFVWDGVLKRGLTFRNYGEMNYTETVPRDASFAAIYRDYTDRAKKIGFTHSIGIDNLRRYSHPTYPGWNMRIPDVLRADIYLAELRKAEASGKWPNLQIVYLPQDHASGTSPGYPTPRAHIADNDLALGRIVEGISKSRFWPKTCIFVIEDDPQDGFDHVDGHRSIALVISPYTKRGAVVSRFYNQTSVLHTLQRILGVPAMNQLDSLAPVMSACFTPRADLRPYTALPNNIPLDELNPPLSSLRGKARELAKQSMAMDFKRVDAAPEDGLNRILWHAAKGVDAPYPAHLAGAHGRGLKARGLQLSKGQVETE